MKISRDESQTEVLKFEEDKDEKIWDVDPLIWIKPNFKTPSTLPPGSIIYMELPEYKVLRNEIGLSKKNYKSVMKTYYKLGPYHTKADILSETQAKVSVMEECRDYYYFGTVIQNASGERIWGLIWFSDGHLIEGNWTNSAIDGRGRFIWPDGRHYIGDFKDGEPNGHGTMYTAYGEKQYEGQIKYGKRNGQGTSFNEYGFKSYEGQFQNDIFHGQGTFYYDDGDKYVGQFEYGEKSGQGIYYYSDGSKYYEGQWKNDENHGKGIIYSRSGDQYDCYWKYDITFGEVAYHFADGRKRIGRYRKSKFEEY